MKRRFTIVAATLALLAIFIAPMGMMGQTTSTYTFTTKSWAATLNGNAANWTSGKDGNQFQNGRGVQVTTGASGANATSPSSFENVSQVVVTYSTNASNGAGSIAVQIGSNTAVSKNVTKTGGTTDRTLEFDYNTTQTGAVKFTVTCTTNSIYVKSISITTTSGGDTPTTYTVTYKPNGPDAADIEDTYTEGTDVTLRPANTFSYEGYTFSEWNTDESGEGDSYEAGGTIEGIDDDVTLFAQWTELAPSDDHTLTFDFEDETAHRTSGSNSYTGTNEYEENGADIILTYADAVGSGSPLSGSYHVLGRVAKNTTNSPVVLIGPIDITNWNITKIEYLTKGVGAMSQVFETSLDGSQWTSQLTISSMPTATTTETVDDLAITGTELYLRWTVSVASSTGANRDFNLDDIVITYTESETPAPTIAAENVALDYDATSGRIVYTINNVPTPAGTLSAATTAEWITLPSSFASPIEFTCTANQGGDERTATVTLTYSYGDDQSVSKNVTVTQGANPNYTMTIAEVREQGTGSVVTKGVVTSCVGTTGYIQDATAAICVYGSELTVGDEIRVSGTLSDYNGLLEITSPQFTVISSGNTVTPAVKTIDQISNAIQAQLVRVEDATVTAISGANTTIAQGENTIVVRNLNDVAVNDVVTLTANVGCYNNNAQLVNPQDVSVQESTEAIVTVTPSTINVPAEGGDGTITLTYENITEFYSFDYNFCDAEGGELQEDPDWIFAEIEEDEDTYTLYYVIDANDSEARTAYLRVYTYDDDEEEVYAIVTVNQAEYVAPSIASLPFSFDGGRADIEETEGLTQEGLGSDYTSQANTTTPLKFDSTDDWLLLQFDERPGTLTFDITGNGFSGSTFKVQTSEDGVTYTDLATYTELGSTQNEEFANLGENVRYIKWIYTNKSSGNVGLGTIALAEYEAPLPTITLNSYSIEATAEGTDGTLTVNYTEITTELDPEIYWFESDGETSASEPDWMTAEINTDLNVEYLILENEGEARTAYFKVYGLDVDGEDVYSDLVTVSQAGAPQQYTLEVASISNAEIFVFDATNPDETYWDYLFEGIDEVQVLEGTPIALSVSADQGYVLETLTVNGVNHAAEIDGGVFIFTMPAENVTITVTTVEDVAPAGGNYVRITSLDQLTDGCKVIIAARCDEEDASAYKAMPGQTSDKPTGVAFTSETSGDDEILPATITASEDDYYWTVNVTNDGYTFTNAENQMIGYTSGTNFATGGNNTVWTITRETAGETAMVAEYTGFVIRNGNTNNRAFAFNNTAFGAYATTNMNTPGYNFFLDFFVQQEPVETETYTIDITGYGNGDGHYYLIASPVYVDPANTNMLTVDENDNPTYDLYYFDQGEDDEWRNYRQGEFNLVPGQGYLYANKNDIQLTFTGVPYDGDGEIELVREEGALFEGWNLVGNPFGEAAVISDNYFEMNEDGDEIVAGESEVIEPMKGVFVRFADTEVEGIVTFEPTATGSMIDDYKKVVLNVTRNRGNVIDRAIVRFGEGRQLPKFQLNENSTKVYFSQGNQDYAVVRSGNEGEMPVNFKAETRGSYTFTVEVKDVEMNYLHLFDTKTGNDIDLLQTPNYTFEANVGDNVNRFRLMFDANAIDEHNAEASFAYFNGSEWVISNMGEATLQVVDVMGRVLRSETINGNAELSISEVSGVYMIRLVNGNNVKVQKVVVR